MATGQRLCSVWFHVFLESLAILLLVQFAQSQNVVLWCVLSIQYVKLPALREQRPGVDQLIVSLLDRRDLL